MCINLPGLTDAARRAALLTRADAAWQEVRQLHEIAEREILARLRESVPTE